MNTAQIATTDWTWHPLPLSFREFVSRQPSSLLLETAKRDQGEERSLIFFNPVEELVAWSIKDLDSLLTEAERQTEAGKFAAGYFTYECGEYFAGLPLLSSKRPESDEPLAWLGVYGPPLVFDHRTGRANLILPEREKEAPKRMPTTLVVNGLEISRRGYNLKFAQIQNHLAAGNTYQVNFTDRISGNILSDPLEAYSTLLAQQPVAFAAYMNAPIGHVLSFSPELFYRTSGEKITVRPMKGTWSRGRDIEEDFAAVDRLRNDVKNRSEHITIVDLLRNDVGKVSELGSVRVEKLLEVERYATLLQMTSTISGRLFRHLGHAAIFRGLFPSGSITGAPKRKTMEIIRELESAPRGVYTGAIGYFGPDREACFNVAIRTLTVRDNQFSMGVGGGITADSKVDEEFKECQMKAAFLTKQDRPFSLIETMRCSRGVPLLRRHLARLAKSAAYFDIVYDSPRLESEIKEAIRSCEGRESRVRMELSLSGSWQIVASAIENIPWRGRILLADDRTGSADIFLRHKTTNRNLYGATFSRAIGAGFDEALFLNEHSCVTEGAVSNIFMHIDGDWVTPSLDCGVLPGIKRAELLETLASAREMDISLDDLQRSTQIWMCNALRGIRPVKTIESEDGTAIWSLENHAENAQFGAGRDLLDIHNYSVLRNRQPQDIVVSTSMVLPATEDEKGIR